MKYPRDLIPGMFFRNKLGHLFIITKYNNCKNIEVIFPATNYTATVQNGQIRNKEVKDKLKPSVLGIGIIGEGEFNQAKDKIAYRYWKNMLDRCYSDKFHIRGPTYRECSVCEEWLNFQNFSAWFYENHIEGYHLDKDIKIKGNKVYSPHACMFVSASENARAARLKTYFD